MDIPFKLLQEMFRVTKVGSHFCVVTYGEPDLRLALFLEALPKFKYELNCEKISLSFMSNFINALRAKSGSTMKEALSNKDVVVSSIMDGNININPACITKLSEQGDDEETQRKLKKMRMMRIYLEAQKLQRREEAEAKRREEAGEEPIKQETLEDIPNEEAREEPIETPEQDPFNQNPKGRRQHCYLYLFKKISS
jgi:hypothetical protein